MDIEKLIKQLRSYTYWLGQDGPESHDIHPIICDDAATALSTLQAENEKLKDQLYDGEGVNLVNYWMQQAKIEENGHRNCQAENEKLRAELEQVKSERDIALEYLHGICFACKNYSPYHNRGKCRFCSYEPARDKDAEANDNWEWRGPQKED